MSNDNKSPKTPSSAVSRKVNSKPHHHSSLNICHW